MSVFARIRRVTNARIESFLSSVEDPELVLPQLVAELEEQIREATNAEAKALASVKSAERGLKEAKDRIDRLQKGAHLALDKEDEATAREALSAQIDAERAATSKEEALKGSQDALEDARQARKQMQTQLDELRLKKDELLTRARINKTQKKVEQTVRNPVQSAQSILDTVARMESKVDEQKAELDIQREMAGSSGGANLDQKLAQLSTDAEVEERLAALRKKSGGKK